MHRWVDGFIGDLMGKMTDWWGIWMDGVMWGGCGLKQKGYLIFDTKSPRALHLWL